MQKPFIVFSVSILIFFIALFPLFSYSQSPKSDQDRVNEALLVLDKAEQTSGTMPKYKLEIARSYERCGLIEEAKRIFNKLST